jgi:putative hydrolase of the HAD superfamily
MPGMSEPPATVIFDFYGTLARSTHWVSIPEVLGEHGFEVSDAAMRRYFEGHDGVEHVEHSQSREHYVAWQRDRMLVMLAETDIHPGEYDTIVEKLRAGTATRVLERYPEVLEVLTTLRDRGVRLAVCSNWDWDLAEALDEAGLAGRFEVVVSSAWAGARKPHPRIFETTLDQLGARPEGILFVGDTWIPDVEGPRSVGLLPAYLERDDHWQDPGAPVDPTVRAAAAACIPDLTGVLDLVDWLEGSTGSVRAIP